MTARTAGRKGRPWRRFRELVLQTYGATCYWCWKPIDLTLPVNHPMEFTVDHGRALARGGHPMDIRTARPMHRSCNSSKGKRDRSAQPIVLVTSRQW